MITEQDATRVEADELPANDGRGHPANDGETAHMLPELEVRFPTTVHWAQRRPLGIGPATLLAGLAGITFVCAIVMLIAGSWPAGIVLLAASATEICLFRVAARREPDSGGARAVRVAGRRTDGLVRVSSVMVRASTQTGVELARLWHRRQLLRVQLRRRLTPLGEAVYRNDQARAEQLKAQARDLEQRLGEADARAAAAKAAMRAEIERERAPAQGTQRLAVAERDSSDSNRAR